MKIAIIGGGISGLMAAHLLSREHHVRLFEAAPRLGGHTYTVPVKEGDRELWIDMGFIVFNDRNYPQFTRLLDDLGVASQPSTMSFSVRCERSGLEYNGGSLNQLFAQRSNLLRSSFHRMLRDILRFHRTAPRLLESEEAPTLGQFLRQEGFSGPFVDHYLLPMTGAIWSARSDQMLDFPARTLITFLDHHGLLQVRGRPQWRAVRGGSRSYVEALQARLGERIVLGTPIDEVRRTPNGVEVKPQRAEAQCFDQVVIATHSDQALDLLADPTLAEREILSAIEYQESDVVLHTDASFLPRRPLARASWNYHLNAPQPQGVQVTYSMNRLQSLETQREYCVTLNRTTEIDPGSILERQRFAHPIFTGEAVAAQKRWSEINGTRRTWFCGAYWSWGFHEDGARSACRVAEAIRGRDG
ncbi:MAG: FAD-dependent oxidoreductase [Acidobacteriota bacterium]